MKIIYLHQYFNSLKMSGGTRSFEMARRLFSKGHEVHIITTCRDFNPTKTRKWKHTLESGIHVHWLNVPYSNKMNFYSRIKAFLIFAFSSSFKAISIKGDIVFATSTPLTIAIPGILTSKKLGIPMVFEVRDLWPELPIAVGILKNPILIRFSRLLEIMAYKNSEHIVALSPGMAKGIIDTGYPKEKVSTIPNSSDIELFQVPKTAGQSFLNKHPRLKGGPLIVYAGTLGLINGVSYLVDIAISMLKIDNKIKFLIAGDGKEFQNIQNYAKRNKVLNNNLWMINSVPKNEIPFLLSAATVATSLFIDLPEMWNNSANKFFDALAAGKPIIINYSGWQAELLKKHDAGIVIPPNSPNEAAQHIFNYLEDKTRVQRSGLASFSLAKTEFNRDLLANKLSQILEDVAG